MLCPSNQPFRGAHKARLKSMQKVAPTVFQYKCKDCGLLLNHDVSSEMMSHKKNHKLLSPRYQKYKAQYRKYLEKYHTNENIRQQ